MANISSITKVCEARYAALPLAVRQSALPFLFVSLPLMMTSITGAFQLAPLVVLLSSYQLYLMTKFTDTYMFTLNKMAARLAVTFPLCTFISIWSMLLSLLSPDKKMLNGVVGPFCLLLLIACAPAYRWSETRTARRVPLWVSFSAAGSFAVIASLVHAF